MSLYYSNETCNEIRKTIAACPGTVAAAELERAALDWNPILCAMDALLRAAKVYKARFGQPIAADFALGPPWLSAARNIRFMLNGDFGPIDSGTVESIFWVACGIAGFNAAAVG